MRDSMWGTPTHQMEGMMFIAFHHNINGPVDRQNIDILVHKTGPSNNR